MLVPGAVGSTARSTEATAQAPQWFACLHSQVCGCNTRVSLLLTAGLVLLGMCLGLALLVCLALRTWLNAA